MCLWNEETQCRICQLGMSGITIKRNGAVYIHKGGVFIIQG